MAEEDTRGERPSSRYIAPLDGLRGIAIAAVFLYHEDLFAGPTSVTALDRGVHAIAALGWAGVDLFFVLSGYLITGILIDAKGTANYFRTFYARRVLRIFPAYYAFLALYFFVRPHLPVGHYPAVDPGVQLWSWDYTSNVLVAIHGWTATPKTIDHFWSLAVEEQFYFAWPLLVFALPRRWLTVACLALTLSALGTRVAFIGAEHWDAARVLMPARIDSFAVGGLLALAMRAPTGPTLLAKWAWPCAGVAGALIPGLYWVPWMRFEALATITLAIAVLSGALIAAAATASPRSTVYRVLGAGPLPFVGRYSYALYIVHQPVILGLLSLGVRPTIVHAIGGSVMSQRIAFGAIAGAVSLAAALASWYLLERPCLALKRHFRYGSVPSDADDAQVPAVAVA